MTSLSQWYKVNENDRCFDPAREAFTEALATFQSTICYDARKQALLNGVDGVEDLQRTLTAARLKYEVQRQDSKASKWIASFSSRVGCYGKIMDVLVQQHPEYVSLAWGSMKLLFVLVQNHEKLVKTLAKGMSKIADHLPLIELATILYPTSRVKRAVAELYRDVIKFLIRAHSWYQQSPLQHAWEALARPVELRYDDLITQIGDHAREIDRLADAGERAEQRDVHSKVHELLERQKASDLMLVEMRQMLMAHHAITSSSLVQANQSLNDLQLNQVMDYLSCRRSTTPMESFRLCLSASKRRGPRRPSVLTSSAPSPFWTSPKISRWSLQRSAAVVMVRGDYGSRFLIKDFGVKVVQMLRQQDEPVVWALKASLRAEDATTSIIEVLKDLVDQILRLNIAARTEKSMSLTCAQFRGAETEAQWFELLAAVVAPLPRLYIIIDLESIDFASSPRRFSWLSSFLSLFASLSSRGIRSILKVVLLSYGSGAKQEPNLAEFHDYVLPVRQNITQKQTRSDAPQTLRNIEIVKRRNAEPARRCT